MAKEKGMFKVVNEDNTSIVDVKHDNFSIKRDEQIAMVRNQLERVLSSDYNIVSFRKVKDKNYVSCLLEDGHREIVPVDQSLQLIIDKLDLSPYDISEVSDVKDKVEICPYQNKVYLVEGLTGRTKKILDIDKNLSYEKKGAQANFDSRLNPVVLAALSGNSRAQSAYANNEDGVKVVYNYEVKSNNIIKNLMNKRIVRKMNQYYKSENAFSKVFSEGKNAPKKIGFAGLLDRIQTNLSKRFKKTANKSDKTNSGYPEIQFVNKQKNSFDDRIKVDLGSFKTSSVSKTSSQKAKSKSNGISYGR